MDSHTLVYIPEAHGSCTLCKVGYAMNVMYDYEVKCSVIIIIFVMETIASLFVFVCTLQIFIINSRGGV